MANIFSTAGLKKGEESCTFVALTDVTDFRIDTRGPEVKISYKPPGPSVPVELNTDDADVMMALSTAFTAKDGQFKVPDAELEASYLPVQLKPDAGEFTHTFEVVGKDGKTIGQKYTLKTRGWVTANGTQIRYVTEGLPKEIADKELIVGLTPKGGVEQLMRFGETE